MFSAVQAVASSSYREFVVRLDEVSSTAPEFVVHLPITTKNERIPTLVFFHGMRPRDLAKRTPFIASALSESLASRGWAVFYPQLPGHLVELPSDADSSKHFCEVHGNVGTAVDEARQQAHLVEVFLANMPLLDKNVVFAGHSRGGALALLVGSLSNTHRGVINFSGGWVGGGCHNFSAVNSSLLTTAANSDKLTLWIYGDNDSIFSMRDIAQMLMAYTKAGGRAMLLVKSTGAQNDHALFNYRQHWSEALTFYLTEVTKDR